VGPRAYNVEGTLCLTRGGDSMARSIARQVSEVAVACEVNGVIGYVFEINGKITGEELAKLLNQDGVALEGLELVVYSPTGVRKILGKVTVEIPHLKHFRFGDIRLGSSGYFCFRDGRDANPDFIPGQVEPEEI
jgi:hypothetical protein